MNDFERRLAIMCSRDWCQAKCHGWVALPRRGCRSPLRLWWLIERADDPVILESFSEFIMLYYK